MSDRGRQLWLFICDFFSEANVKISVWNDGPLGIIKIKGHSAKKGNLLAGYKITEDQEIIAQNKTFIEVWLWAGDYKRV